MVGELQDQLNSAEGLHYFELKKFPSPIPVPARNSMTLRLPFREEWGVMWGGRNLIDNYHNDTHALNQFAVDFIVVDGNDLRFKGDGQANDDYFAFGKEILAVAPGRVVEVVDGYPDNLPGFSGTLSGGGNTVTIEHANREFSNYIHLKHQSIAVKVGDVVTVGQVIARCGNSGQSPAPHLHFGLVNSENAAFATGFPVFFGDVAVMRDGRVEVMKDYEPKRGDLVSPAATPSPQGPPPK